ncbi:SLC13 family permease [Salibacterium halotolerans]|uniref:Anion transporter n=1 Tax=Salibacterium halotolerans TaxID=1884432 RepID=A0A1I5RMN6_9BACI|nr:SLC13 family permease [Salibacterium halotolerans]SFP59812.1 anion transporter [Salibacterium halotolerans]
MKKNNVLTAVVIVLYGMFFLPWLDWSIQIQAVSALVMIQILWIGRVFPLAFSSILLILLLSFHFFSYDETLSFFGSELVWLLFSTFILAHAFIQTGLAGRVSLSILRLCKGSGRLLIFISFALMFVLTVFIPSNIGKGSLISSILDDISQRLQSVQFTPNLSKSMFIGISYVSAISAAFVPTGASSTIYAFGIFSEVSSEMTYVHWLLYLGAPILVFVFLLGGLLELFFPAEKVNHELVKHLLNTKFVQLGAWTWPEIKMTIISGIILLLWMTQSLHDYSIPLVGLLGAVLTVLPYSGVLTWEQAKKGINWDMMIFFAATLMLSNMLISTDTIDIFASYVSSLSNHYPSLILVLTLIIFTALIRIIFVNVLGFLTIMLPLSVTLGEQITGISPLSLGMAVYLTGVPGFILVTQSPVHLISYSYGYFTEKDLWKVGSAALVVWVGLIFASFFFYWNHII